MKRRYLRLLPILLICMMMFIPLAPSNAWKIWGQEIPSGDIEIQIFWYSEINKKDFRIPQDLDLLELDSFCIWMRFEKVDEINFSVQIYDYSVHNDCAGQAYSII